MWGEVESYAAFVHGFQILIGWLVDRVEQVSHNRSSRIWKVAIVALSTPTLIQHVCTMEKYKVLWSYVTNS